jgi:hypothetical protein
LTVLVRSRGCSRALLSAQTWALAVVTVMLIVYPIARIVIPAVLNAIVPEVVRTVLNLIRVRLGHCGNDRTRFAGHS